MRIKKTIFLILFLFFIVSLFIFSRISKVYQKIYQPKQIYNTPVPEKNEYVFALVGYGGEGHDGAYLTDSILLIHVNFKKKLITLISVPRDIWVPVSTKSGEPFGLKINAVYQLGFFPQTYPDAKTKKDDEIYLFKEAIKSITNLQVDYYISIDFNGFVKAVDLLGGVEIDVKKTFDDYVYPIAGKETDLCNYPEDKLSEIDARLATEEPQIVFPCRYEHLHFEKGLQTMDGKTALKYVRSRHGFEDGGDFGRASRQQEFLLAFKKKIFSIQSIPNILNMAETLAPYIQTDIPPEVITKFIKNALLLQHGNIERIILSEDNVLASSYSEERGYILIPKDKNKKWKSVHEYVQMKINRISPTPNPSLNPTNLISQPVKNN